MKQLVAAVSDRAITLCWLYESVTVPLCVLLTGHVDILEWMLHHSLATGLERDDYGATPIHDAAEQNQLECLHVFFNHSVNLDPRDGDGMTPLDLAEEKAHVRCVQFLLNPKQSLQEFRRKSRDIKASHMH